MLGDLLAAAVNPNVGAFTLSPAATEIEVADRALDRRADRLSRRRAAGCSSAAATWPTSSASSRRAPRSAGWDVRARAWPAGGRRAARLRLGRDAHLDPEGGRPLGPRHRRDPLDPDRRGPAHGPRRARARRSRRTARPGDLPFLVVGTAGSVSTGAVDPLPAHRRVCREHEQLWFHVDGAYGGFAAPRARGAGRSARRLALADSVAVDPHKWLYAPLEAGCALVRDPRAPASPRSPTTRRTTTSTERATNFVDYGMQNSRGFRALKVWLALRTPAPPATARMIGDDIALARVLDEAVGARRRSSSR